MKPALAFVFCAALCCAQPASVRERFENARGLYNEHDDSGEALAEAEREFRLLLSADPSFAAARAYLGLIALEGDRKDQARADFAAALQSDPNCAEARVGLARLATSESDAPGALALLRRAVSGSPANELALSELAWTLTAESQHPTDPMWREAMSHWRTLISLSRDDRDSHHALAKAYVRFREWPEAERHFREVLRIGQTVEDSDVWVYSVHAELAAVLEKQGRLEEAIREYEALAVSEGAGEQEIAEARARIAQLRAALLR